MDDKRIGFIQPRWGRGADKKPPTPSITTRHVAGEAKPWTPPEGSRFAAMLERGIVKDTPVRNAPRANTVRVGSRKLKSLVGRGWSDGDLWATVIEDDGTTVKYRYGHRGHPAPMGEVFEMARVRAQIRCRRPDKPAPNAIEPAAIRSGRRFNSQSPAGKSWLPIKEE